MEDLDRFWSFKSEDIIEKLETSRSGISDEEATIRLQKYGDNKFEETKKQSAISLFISQFKGPIIILLGAHG